MELQKPKGNEPHEDPRMKTLETTASAPIKPSPLASRLQSPPPPTSPSLPQQPASEENVEELRKEGDEGGEQKATKPPSTEIAEAEGPVTDLQKKLRRAERFGVTVQLSEHEKRSSRAERFGTGSTLPGTIAGSAEEQKRKARAERFGLVGHSTDDEAKKESSGRKIC